LRWVFSILKLILLYGKKSSYGVSGLWGGKGADFRYLSFLGSESGSILI
jgi:hypothetical protein